MPALIHVERSNVKSYFNYCPRCAGLLEWKRRGNEPRFQRCKRCGYSLFNNPVGATEAVIIRNGRILMIRRAKEPRKGFWDFPGGFIDGFETPGEGIIREVREETGFTFKPTRLVGVYVNTQYLWHGRRVPCIVVSFLGRATGRLSRNHEAASSRWIDLRRIRQTAFSYQKQVLRDLKNSL